MEPSIQYIGFDYDAETQRALDAIAHRAPERYPEIQGGYLPASCCGAVQRVRTLHVLPGDSVSDSDDDGGDADGGGGGGNSVGSLRLSRARGMLLYAIRRLSAPEEEDDCGPDLRIRDTLLLRTVEETEYLLGVDPAYRGAGALARLRAARKLRADNEPETNRHAAIPAAWTRAVDEYYEGECRDAIAYLDKHNHRQVPEIAELEEQSRILIARHEAGEKLLPALAEGADAVSAHLWLLHLDD